MLIRIEGHDLPGDQHVQVGVQRGTEVVDRVSAVAPEAAWRLEVTSREIDDTIDLGGPYVHGRRGARFVYLSWGTGNSAEPNGPVSGPFAMFRRAKLMIDGVPTDVLRGAHVGGTLVGRLGLTGADGGPRCAAVRPPDVTWTVV